MTRQPDPEKLQAQATELGGLLRGAMLASTVSLGVRLGLSSEMRDAGP